MAYLRYVDDAGHLRTKVLDSTSFLIGRAASCQLSIDSEMISREHVRIDMESDGRFRIRDLGSRNKTYVNGELIRETMLTSGVVIRAGDHVIEFVDETVSPESIDLDFLSAEGRDPPDCEWIKIKSLLSLTFSQVERLAQLVSDQPLSARAEYVSDAALGALLLDLQADRGFIALRGEGKTELHMLAHRALKKSPGGSITPVSQFFVFAALFQGVAGRYPRTAGKLESELGCAVTAIVAPLTSRGEVVGLLYLDRPKAKKPFSSSALQQCAAAGAQIGALIGESANRLAQNAGREGATWMSTIRQLQSVLKEPLAISDSFDAAVKCHPGRLRCGDFESVIPIDEQRCGIVVIDGGGHGIAGIAQASAIRTALRVALAVSEEALMEPEAMFNTVNRQVASSGARQILPCTYVGIDMAAGKLAYINAGGTPPLLMVAPGRLVTLDQLSLVLGVDPEYIYEPTRVNLPETFRIVSYTDGLTEATSAAGETFGDQRLHDVLLERDAFASAAEVIAKIDAAWAKHMGGAQPADDALAVVVARG